MAQNASQIWQGLPFQTQKYYIKKGAINNTPGFLDNMSGDQLLQRINAVNRVKGGAEIYDPAQIDAAASPLIAQRNKRGIGGILGTALNVALPIIGGAIGGPLGAAAGGAIAGGATGGNLKSALIGGATAGATAGLSSGLGNVAKVGKLGGGSAGSGILGSLTRAGGTLADIGYGLDKTINTASGIGRTISGAVGLPGPKAATWGGATSAPAGAGGSITMGNPLATALSGVKQYMTQSDIEDELMKAQRQAQSAISPFAATGYQANRQLADALAAGFNPGDLENDPGYQFRMGQGQRQLEQSLAARGLGQSGAALKAAQEYGQNFAASEFADAYNRWLQNNQQLAQQSGQGLGAAGATADIYANMGNIGANAIAGRNNAVTGTLSSILSGRGIIGFDAMGNPVYG